MGEIWTFAKHPDNKLVIPSFPRRHTHLLTSVQHTTVVRLDLYALPHTPGSVLCNFYINF